MDSWQDGREGDQDAHHHHRRQRVYTFSRTVPGNGVKEEQHRGVVWRTLDMTRRVNLKCEKTRPGEEG